MGLFTAIIFVFATGLLLAWSVAVAAEKDIWRIGELLSRFGRQPRFSRVFLGLFVLALWVYASTKRDDGDDDGGRIGRVAIRSVEDDGVTNTERTLTEEDFRRGLVLTRVGTNETFDFNAPADAVVCEDWRKFGAAEDWFYLVFSNWGFKVGENEINRFRIFSNGLIEFSGESRGDDETQSASRALQVDVSGNDLKAGASGLLRRCAPRNDRLAGDVVSGMHSWLAEYCSIDALVIGKRKWIAPFCVPLGNPVKGHIAGFVWFATDEPIQIATSAFQLLSHPNAQMEKFAPERGVKRAKWIITGSGECKCGE